MLTFSFGFPLGRCSLTFGTDLGEARQVSFSLVCLSLYVQLYGERKEESQSMRQIKEVPARVPGKRFVYLPSSNGPLPPASLSVH
jgi:hypothetical protein